MKKNFVSNSFAVLTAALLMVSSVACSTVPTQEEAPLAESSAPVADSSLDSSMASQPVVEEPTQDSVSASTMDPMSAPSSLGASSSGRGH